MRWVLSWTPFEKACTHTIHAAQPFTHSVRETKPKGNTGIYKPLLLLSSQGIYFGKTTIAYFVSQKRLICQGWSNIPVSFTLRKNTEQLHRNLWLYPQTAGISLGSIQNHSFTFLIVKIIFSLVIFCSFHICKSQYAHGRSNLHLLLLPGLICIRWGGKIHTMEF